MYQFVIVMKTYNVLSEVGNELLYMIYMSVCMLSGNNLFKFVSPGHLSLLCLNRVAFLFPAVLAYFFLTFYYPA